MNPTRRGFLGTIGAVLGALAVGKKIGPILQNAPPPGMFWPATVEKPTHTTASLGFRVSAEVIEDDKYGVLRQVNEVMIENARTTMDDHAASIWTGEQPPRLEGEAPDYWDDDYDW